MKDNTPRMILSVGCGRRPAEANLIRLDKAIEVSPDVVWDLDKFPYPFDDSSFSEIECMDVIEHLESIPAVMEEFHRLLSPDGLLRITTPHFSSANSYIDPTHKWHLSRFSLDYFCEGHDLAYYSCAKFRIRKQHIQFKGGRFTRSLVSRLANKFPEFYEQRCAWIFPAWYLHFEMEAVK